MDTIAFSTTGRRIIAMAASGGRHAPDPGTWRTAPPSNAHSTPQTRAVAARELLAFPELPVSPAMASALTRAANLQRFGRTDRYGFPTGGDPGATQVREGQVTEKKPGSERLPSSIGEGADVKAGGFPALPNVQRVGNHFAIPEAGARFAAVARAYARLFNRSIVEAQQLIARRRPELLRGANGAAIQRRLPGQMTIAPNPAEEERVRLAESQVDDAGFDTFRDGPVR